MNKDAGKKMEAINRTVPINPMNSEGSHPSSDLAGQEGQRKETFVVPMLEQPVRLDIFLSHAAGLPSRSQVQRAIEEDRVFVNGALVKMGFKLKAGDLIALFHKEPAPSTIQPEEIALNIIYEDHSILVVDKPAGMVVHPAFGHHSGTLVNAILAHCHDLSGIGGVQRPGIVHRLDKDTSGLLVVAKTDQAHQSLVAQFKGREVEKVYLALVHGRVKDQKGFIDLPIGRDPAHRKKMSTRSSRGKEARTAWQALEFYRQATLLEVRIETGRTHQIRVHLSASGHPVVGDSLYGGIRNSGNIDDKIRVLLRGMRRQALHAASLSFLHPLGGERIVFSSPLPPDMTALCGALRASSL
ncbi:MAG: RluA family pseudouridine synthase [Smithellaceae bacterium]|nr:RluA family pseudouridine synthase [Smithellaceae bacterium]